MVSSLPSLDRPNGSKTLPPTSTVLGVAKISSLVALTDVVFAVLDELGAKAEADETARARRAMEDFMVGLLCVRIFYYKMSEAMR
jgi:hypothetical protein